MGILWPILAFVNCIYFIAGIEPPRKQILLVGLENAGKTTLLYRLKVPQWRWDKTGENGQGSLTLPKDSKTWTGLKKEGRDPSYHYEEFSTTTGTAYAIWDLPGNDAMRRIWPTFYRSMQVSGVLFVVDGADDPWNETFENRDKVRGRVQAAKDEFHRLLHEDELRGAAFCVIVNNKHGSYVKDNDHWRYELGLGEDPSSALHRSLKGRVSFHVLDFAEKELGWFVQDFVEQSIIKHVNTVSIMTSSNA